MLWEMFTDVQRHFGIATFYLSFRPSCIIFYDPHLCVKLCFFSIQMLVFHWTDVVLIMRHFFLHGITTVFNNNDQMIFNWPMFIKITISGIIIFSIAYYSKLKKLWRQSSFSLKTYTNFNVLTNFVGNTKTFMWTT